MTEPGDLPQLIGQELIEDCVEEGMSLDVLGKLKAFKVPKGVGRVSLVMMARRINQEDPSDGAYIPLPKKTINRINYIFLRTAMDVALDPAVRLAYFKELHDRLDGKSPQAVHLGDSEGGKLEITWRE